MKDFAFPQLFSSPSLLSLRLLGDLATLFERESNAATSSDERSRLYKISRDLDRVWRVKAAKAQR